MSATVLFVSIIISLFNDIWCLPEPSEYILSFPTDDNPMNIKVTTPIEKNYFMLVGDWGAEALQNKQVQQTVADKMNNYYNKQALNGYNLLAVLALGDNFYYTGQTCDEYEDHWTSIYGANLTSVPWLAVMGNHDWGDSDEWAMCAWNAPSSKQHIDPITNIPYAANQLNKDKGGCNPNMFYLPDFGYFYSIKELNFELITVEESTHDCTDIGGGYGSTVTYENCGGFEIGCNYLGKISNATENMLINRAKTSNASNILIMQHYPAQYKRLKSLFTSNRNGGNRSNDIVWTIFGHSHVQKCEHHDENNICDAILSGGGGGCCTERSLRGFYVIGFDKNGDMIQPLSFNDPTISCEYPCNESIDFDSDFMIQQAFEICCHIKNPQDLNCSLYDLSQCSTYYNYSKKKL